MHVEVWSIQDVTGIYCAAEFSVMLPKKVI